jgi:transposase
MLQLTHQIVFSNKIKNIMIESKQFVRGEITNRYLTEFQRQLLKKNLKTEQAPEYRQRIEIMLMADAGKTQSQICRTLSCSQLTARHWSFVAKSGQAHNWKAQPIGRPKTVTSDYLERLKELIGSSPKDLGYPFSRWTGQWLERHLASEFNIVVSARHINRLIEKIETEVRLITEVDSSQDLHQRSRNLVIADLSNNHLKDSSAN